MCGFVGFTGAVEDKKVITRMMDRIAHRGPDDAEFYADDDISLGFRRLSIIDLDGGRQPIFNEDGSKVLVFNGEIYNFLELKKELSQINLQIEDLQADLHLTNDVLLIREIAQEECGMIGEEYVRTETLSIGDGESVETYPDGKPEGVGLSTLLSAIGIKK